MHCTQQVIRTGPLVQALALVSSVIEELLDQFLGDWVILKSL